MTLTDAISAVEAETSKLANADAAVQQAQASVDAAQAKLASAQQAKSDADSADNSEVVAYNTALTDLIAAAQAAMRMSGGQTAPQS